MTRGVDDRFGALTSDNVADTFSTQDILNAFTAYHNLAAIYLPPGLRAARPASSKFGRFYLATDTGGLYLDTGTAWVVITEPVWLTYMPAARQTNAIATNTSVSGGTYNRQGRTVLFNASLTTAATHSGGGGRLLVNLPIPHAQVGTILGTFSVATGSPVGTIGVGGTGTTFWSGNVTVTTVSTSFAALQNYDGNYLGDSPYAGDFPAGTTIQVNLAYKSV